MLIKRLIQLDFLRGIAIILVLVRHRHLLDYTDNMGWIGVDLFFVLSGFLVSNLLFKEYQNTGRVQPLRFLIRRGFKIYPLYYLFLPIYMLRSYFLDHYEAKYFITEVFFIQNYACGFGYSFMAGWSLAIEEHFYILISVFAFIFTNIAYFSTRKYPKYAFEILIISIMTACLIARIQYNINYPNDTTYSFTTTHFRIDALLMGVLIAYYYAFKQNYLIAFTSKIKPIILPIIMILLLFTPFIEPVSSFFVKTIGFTMVYIAFGLILTYFLCNTNINIQLNRLLTSFITNIISQIGVYSYAIYLCHTFINMIAVRIGINNHYIVFIIYFIGSISFGKLVANTIEIYFLRLRNKYYP